MNKKIKNTTIFNVILFVMFLCGLAFYSLGCSANEPEPTNYLTKDWIGFSYDRIHDDVWEQNGKYILELNLNFYPDYAHNNSTFDGQGALFYMNGSFSYRYNFTIVAGTLDGDRIHLTFLIINGSDEYYLNFDCWHKIEEDNITGYLWGFVSGTIRFQLDPGNRTYMDEPTQAKLVMCESREQIDFNELREVSN